MTLRRMALMKQLKNFILAKLDDRAYSVACEIAVEILNEEDPTIQYSPHLFKEVILVTAPRIVKEANELIKLEDWDSDETQKYVA